MGPSLRKDRYVEFYALWYCSFPHLCHNFCRSSRATEPTFTSTTMSSDNGGPDSSGGDHKAGATPPQPGGGGEQSEASNDDKMRNGRAKGDVGLSGHTNEDVRESNQLQGLSMNSSANEATVSCLSDASNSSFLSASLSDRNSIISRLSPANLIQVGDMSDDENTATTGDKTTTVQIVQSPGRRQRPSSSSSFNAGSREEKRKFESRVRKFFWKLFLPLTFVFSSIYSKTFETYNAFF